MKKSRFGTNASIKPFNVSSLLEDFITIAALMERHRVT